MYPLQTKLKNTSRIIFGCMGLGGDWNEANFTSQHVKQAHDVIDAALDLGITQFDHADIYTAGKAEKVFGEVLGQRPELREQICIQSKCGIRFEDDLGPGRYDFSKDWITQSVDGILQRLKTEYIDCLILHRPDPLMELTHVAEAFNQLQQQGKVLHFGVSNMNLHQIQYLQSGINQPLIVNQIEMSLSHLDWLDDGVTGCCAGYSPTTFVSGTLEYCQQQKIQLQAWGCLSQGLFTGRDVTGQPEPIVNTVSLIATLSEKYQVTKEAIVLTWLMKHPAMIQPVIGTTQLARIKACAEATKVHLTREDWYKLYVSSRGTRLP